MLFLNTSLTVRAHAAASHAGKGWEELTGAALRCVAARPAAQGVVFMAWGLPAQKALARVGVDEVRLLPSNFSSCTRTPANPLRLPQAAHLVLRSAHPSPLSALRPPVPFVGCGHFSHANRFLAAHRPGTGSIRW